jgi:DNA-directed RNA polymerase subunit N (RpoN/RPB10)
MKKLLIFLLLTLSVSVVAQVNSLEIEGNKTDSINKICKERGHVHGDVGMSTLLYCPPYVIDEKEYTIMVYPGCNYTTYTCQRCGQSISEKDKEYRDTIWKGKSTAWEEAKITEIKEKKVIDSLGMIRDTASWYITESLPTTDSLLTGYSRFSTLAIGLSFNDPDTSKVIFFCKEPGQQAGFVTYQQGYMIYHIYGGKREYFDRYWKPIKKTVLYTVEDTEAEK